MLADSRLLALENFIVYGRLGKSNAGISRYVDSFLSEGMVFHYAFTKELPTIRPVFLPARQ
jgi:hypothetical protein